jgi:hypothetical protein
LGIQICAVHLFQNASVLPYHPVYESVLAFVEPLLLIFAEVCPRFLDKTHPGPVKKTDHIPPFFFLSSALALRAEITSGDSVLSGSDV